MTLGASWENVFFKDWKYYIVINRLKKCALAVLLLLGLLSGCSDGLVGDMGQDGREKIRLAGEISQLAVTRVNDDGFVTLTPLGCTWSIMMATLPERLRPMATMAIT